MRAAPWPRRRAFCTWGLSQPTPQGIAQTDVRAVGTGLSGTNVIFGFNTHNRTSTTLAFQEIDICIDTSGGPRVHAEQDADRHQSAASELEPGGHPVDDGALPDRCELQHQRQRQPVVHRHPADRQLHPANGGPEGRHRHRGLGLTAANPRFKYQVHYFGTDGFGAAMPGTGSFNAFTPALTFANTGAVAVNGTRAVTVTGNAAEAGVVAVAWGDGDGSGQRFGREPGAALYVSPP